MDPQVGDKLTYLKQLCDTYKFKLVDLILLKDRSLHDEDSFVTGRNFDKDKLDARSRLFMLALKNANITVRRYKIESAILDERYDT